MRPEFCFWKQKQTPSGSGVPLLTRSVGLASSASLFKSTPSTSQKCRQWVESDRFSETGRSIAFAQAAWERSRGTDGFPKSTGLESLPPSAFQMRKALRTCSLLASSQLQASQFAPFKRGRWGQGGGSHFLSFSGVSAGPCLDLQCSGTS